MQSNTWCKLQLIYKTIFHPLLYLFPSPRRWSVGKSKKKHLSGVFYGDRSRLHTDWMWIPFLNLTRIEFYYLEHGLQSKYTGQSSFYAHRIIMPHITKMCKKLSLENSLALFAIFEKMKSFYVRRPQQWMFLLHTKSEDCRWTRDPLKTNDTYRF